MQLGFCIHFQKDGVTTTKVNFPSESTKEEEKEEKEEEEKEIKPEKQWSESTERQPGKDSAPINYPALEEKSQHSLQVEETELRVNR